MHVEFWCWGVGDFLTNECEGMSCESVNWVELVQNCVQCHIGFSITTTAQDRGVLNSNYTKMHFLSMVHRGW
jgi:hypothetical protein